MRFWALYLAATAPCGPGGEARARWLPVILDILVSLTLRTKPLAPLPDHPQDDIWRLTRESLSTWALEPPGSGGSSVLSPPPASRVTQPSKYLTY